MSMSSSVWGGWCSSVRGVCVCVCVCVSLACIVTVWLSLYLQRPNSVVSRLSLSSRVGYEEPVGMPVSAVTSLYSTTVNALVASQ